MIDPDRTPTDRELIAETLGDWGIDWRPGLSWPPEDPADAEYARDERARAALAPRASRFSPDWPEDLLPRSEDDTHTPGPQAGAGRQAGRTGEAPRC